MESAYQPGLWMEYHISPITGPGDSVRGVLVRGRDISARKATEEALRLDSEMMAHMAEQGCDPGEMCRRMMEMDRDTP